jgi:arylsulfatase A-like enzyme
MRNIVLIVIDTLRADHLGCYGYQRPTSPFLDKLAGDSLVLDNLYSASNFTAPAFTSLFTASYPSRHGVFDFYAQPKHSPIRKCFEANEALLHGIVSFRFFPNLLSHIWGTVENAPDTRSFDYSKELPRAISDGAVEWLEAYKGDRPFCLFLHYDGPHIPYRLPDKYADMFDSVDPESVSSEIRNAFFPQHMEHIGRSDADNEPVQQLKKIIKNINTRGHEVDAVTRQWLTDKYDASIRYTDDMVARVYESLQSLGLLDDTLLCVLSDHGEELWDHGDFGHAGIHMYDEIIRTVGILHDPRDPEGWRSALPSSHVQILPSLLDLAGAKQVPEAIESLGLGAALAREEQGKKPEPVFCSGTFKSVVRLDNLKLIRMLPNRRDSRLKRLKLTLRMLLTGKMKEELYDLSADPGEQNNLAGNRRLKAPLLRLLRQHFEESAVEAPPEEPGDELDEKEREKIEKELKDLGYM